MDLGKYGWLLRVAAAGAAMFMFAFARPAAADTATETGASKTGTLDEVIVTATRRPETLQDVPMTVDIATGTTLQNYSILDMKDVSQLAAGLEMTNTTGRNNTSTLRGISFDPDSGAAPAVDVYLNDIPIDAQTAFTAIYDVDQIDVLRGPQGSLRGRTAPAGAITLTTRRPDLNELTGYGMASVTTDHGSNAQGALSLPMIPGVLAIRVAALDDRNDINDVYDVQRGGQESHSSTQSGRVSVAWQPSETFNLNLMYQYLHADNTQYQQVLGPGSAPALVPFGDPTLSGPPAGAESRIGVQEGQARFRNNTNFVDLNFNWDLGPATLAFLGGRQYTNLAQYRDQDSGNSVPGFQNMQTTRVPYPIDTAELRLLSKDSGFWGWTLGTFYNKQTGTTEATSPQNGFFFTAPYSAGLYLPIKSDTFVPVYSRTIAFFGSSSFKMTDKLTFEASLRYSQLKATQTAETYVTSPGFPGAPFLGIGAIPPFSTSVADVPANIAETSEKPVTGGATLTYKATPDITTYLAYGHSFRAPTAGVGVPSNVSNSLIKTPSETSNAIELGIKTILLDRYSLNADIFFQKFQNYFQRFFNIPYDNGMQVYGVGVGPPDGRVDGAFDFNYAGNATVKGLETTFEEHPTQNWDFSVNASFVQARWNNALLPCANYNAAGNPIIIGSGNVSYCLNNGRLSPVPDFNFSGRSEVRLPMGAYTPFARALITYRPNVEYPLQNYEYPSLTLVNMFLGVRGGDKTHWEVSAYVKNMFNESKVTNISSGNATVSTYSGTPYNSGYRTVNVTNPREGGLMVYVGF